MVRGLYTVFDKFDEFALSKSEHPHRHTHTHTHKGTELISTPDIYYSKSSAVVVVPADVIDIRRISWERRRADSIEYVRHFWRIVFSVSQIVVKGTRTIPRFVTAGQSFSGPAPSGFCFAHVARSLCTRPSLSRTSPASLRHFIHFSYRIRISRVRASDRISRPALNLGPGDVLFAHRLFASSFAVEPSLRIWRFSEKYRSGTSPREDKNGGTRMENQDERIIKILGLSIRNFLK